MTKQEFLNALGELTGAMNEGERSKLLDYYAEMIDDRVEEGVQEEAAVAAMGDPADIAREFAPAASPAPAAAAGSESVDALRSLRLKVANADVKIVSEPLDNGAAAQLRFTDPTRFEWRMDGDTLVVQERGLEEKHRGLEFGLRWLKQMITEPDLRVTVALAEGLADALDFEGGGSDLRVEGVAFAKAQLVTANGDITLKNIACEGGIGIDIRTHSGDVKLTDVRSTNMIVHAASGDISAQGLKLSGRLRLEASSGDIDLRDGEGDVLSVTTASGDIEVRRGRFGATTVHAASGDVRLDGLETDPQLTVQTASGDIDLTRCIARETRINTASGDVNIRLEPLPCGYDILANTVSGDVHFDDGCTAASYGEKPKIAVKTVSGDIDARPAR